MKTNAATLLSLTLLLAGLVSAAEEKSQVQIRRLGTPDEETQDCNSYVMTFDKDEIVYHTFYLPPNEHC